MKIFTICALCLAILPIFGFSAAGCSARPQQEEYITIGALLPLTGGGSDEGLRALNGLQLAKEEINARGGILGKMLDIIVLNDRGDEEYIVQQYNELKERGVAAIIGSSYSGPTMALAEASEKDGIPIISPTASNPLVTVGRRNIFRSIFIDDYQAEVMAYFAYLSLGAETAVVFINRDFNTYIQAAGVFTESFSSLGGHVIAREFFSSEEEFPSLLSKYAENPPAVIFCPEDFIPAAILVNSAHELGLSDTYLLGSDAWDGLLTYVYNPEAMERVFYSAPFSFDDETPQVVQFVRDYFSSFSQMPLTGSATAYTCVYILAEAIAIAGSTNRDDIVSAMKTMELETLLGKIRFDENNNPQINVYAIQIRDGQYSTFEKMSLQSLREQRTLREQSRR
ncbi:MAG: ABC transporter substrate-binding protein [Treponema sp.]|nr:ABC transporter substrate-binding protein [Treponema sp.]